jgi:hypothetical protein
MNAGDASALEQALAFHRSPRRWACLRRQRLPPDVPLLLRLAAAEPRALADSAARTGETPQVVREAAIFYLQQVLFDNDADSYRVLGVDAGASEEQIKHHHRLLVHWLHPDRNRDSWEAVFVDRVNAAWSDLRTAERRLAYDRRRPAPVEADAPTPRLPDAATFADEALPELSGRAVRRAPALVLGMMAAGGVLLIVGLVQLQEPQVAPAPTPRAVAVATPAAPVRRALGPLAPAAKAAAIPSAMPMLAGHLAPAPPPAPAPLPEPLPLPLALAVAPVARPMLPLPLAPVAAPTAIPMPALPEPAPVIAAASVPERAPAPVAIAAGAPPAPVPAAPVMAMARPATPSVPRVMRVDAALAPQAMVEPPPPAPPPPLDERAARDLLARFADHYERGDAAALRALFVAAPGRDGERALRAYAHRFAASDYRRIEFDAVNWLGGGPRGELSALFRETVLERGAPVGTQRTGTLRLELESEGGEPRIARVREDGRRG